ncbi:hypothetical protein BKA70DRAFT_1435926 [Coprinopsis sp. MPI-PUGE-AT-0042]|nr:hypothetical protein BKA70DRAFT_1435926 [Coprinopsis sp. MPI-PUGE-AT-0042]
MSKRRVKDLSVNRGPTTGMVPASESDTCDNGAEVAPLAPAAASGINESPTQVNGVYPIVQAQLVRAMSTATSTVSAGGTRVRKVPCCPHCKDPLKGHSKPLCSQLIGDSVEAGIKSEELEGFLRNPLSVLAGAGTGAAPTANLPVDEENHITTTPSSIRRAIRVSFAQRTLSALPESISSYSKAEVQPSISGWKVEREGFKPEEDEAGDLQALSFLDQAASSDTNLKEVPAPSLQQPAQSTVTSMASSDSEVVERWGWLAFVVFGIFRIGLTVLRVARYLAFKCFQFLALTCTIAMLIDMLKELRQQG